MIGCLKLKRCENLLMHKSWLLGYNNSSYLYKQRKAYIGGWLPDVSFEMYVQASPPTIILINENATVIQNQFVILCSLDGSSAL